MRRAAYASTVHRAIPCMMDEANGEREVREEGVEKVVGDHEELEGDEVEDEG